MVTVRESCKEKNHHWDTTFLHFTIWAAWNLSSLSIKNRTVHTMSPCLLAPSGKKKKKKRQCGTSLVIQWLRLGALNAGRLGLISGQEARSHVLQIRPSASK